VPLHHDLPYLSTALYYSLPFSSGPFSQYPLSHQVHPFARASPPDRHRIAIAHRGIHANGALFSRWFDYHCVRDANPPPSRTTRREWLASNTLFRRSEVVARLGRFRDDVVHHLEYSHDAYLVIKSRRCIDRGPKDSFLMKSQILALSDYVVSALYGSVSVLSSSEPKLDIAGYSNIIKS
jgi:hypothetical protein